MGSGFSAGFARGLAGVLKTTREQELRTQSEEADRALKANLAILGPAIQQGIESDDYTLAERILTEINPDFAKRFKKEGSPFASLGPLLKEQYDLEQGGAQGGARGSAAVESAPAVGAGPLGPRAIPAPSAPPAADVEGPTIFGDPFGISAEERAKRATEATAATQLAPWEAKMTFARRLVDQGAYETLEEALAAVGVAPPAGAQATKGVLASPGQVLLHPTTGEEIGRGLDAAEGGKKPGSFDAQVTRREAELGRKLTTGEVDTLREEFLGVAEAPTLETVSPRLRAMARMASHSPQELQRLTPSETGEVLGVIALDPEMYLRYEGKRQEPMRAMAAKLERSLGALLDTSGATPQLSAGAKMLYGTDRAELGELASRFVTAEGKEAAASIKQLVGQEVLDQIAAMKAQSPTGATGFGQMNMAELDLLIASATVLQNWGLTFNNIGEERALTELIAIQGQLARIREKSDVEVEQQQLLDDQQHRDAAGSTGIIIGDDGSIYQDGVLTIDPEGNLVPPQ